MADPQRDRQTDRQTRKQTRKHHIFAPALQLARVVQSPQTFHGGRGHRDHS